MNLYAIRDKKTGQFVTNIDFTGYQTSLDGGLFVLGPLVDTLNDFVKNNPNCELVAFRIAPNEPARLSDLRDYFDAEVGAMLNDQLASRKGNVISFDIVEIARTALDRTFEIFDLEVLIDERDREKEKEVPK